jgi:hypothetical protein
MTYACSVRLGWGPVPGMMGPMALGGQALNRSMHELGKAYLRSFFIFTKIQYFIYGEIENDFLCFAQGFKSINLSFLIQ